MSLQVDDMKLGQLITVTGFSTPPECDCPSCRRNEPPMAGIPMEILAVNPPYVAVSIYEKPFSLDARHYKFAKVSKQYNNAFAPYFPSYKRYIREMKNAEAKGTCQTEAKGDCRNCGGKTVERRVADGQWKRVCRECGKMAG